MAKESGKILTVEEHQRAGGLGSLVAETLSQQQPTKMHIHGIDDQFGESGTPAQLLAKHKLDKEGIASVVKDFLES